jgi:hypothetical protein
MSTPATSGPSASARRSDATTRISTPRGCARVSTTAMVCGWAPASTTKTLRLRSCASTHMFIASAAAVASSRREALASGKPVRSPIMVWKLMRASRRPCEISAW